LIDGTTAATLGVVDHAVDDAERAAFALAERLGSLPSPAYAAAKRCIAAATGQEDGFALERTEISGLIQTPEAAERLSAFMARSAR